MHLSKVKLHPMSWSNLFMDAPSTVMVKINNLRSSRGRCQTKRQGFALAIHTNVGFVSTSKAKMHGFNDSEMSQTLSQGFSHIECSDEPLTSKRKLIFVIRKCYIFHQKTLCPIFLYNCML